MLSTRPPPPLSSSMEVRPKRYRSGSISSRLRSASELFDEGIVENRQQKGLLKDLIISGDEAVLDALERGDKDAIKSVLRSNHANRKSSLDLLGDEGDLSFDFLSVSATSNALHGAAKGRFDVPFPMDDEDDIDIIMQEAGDELGKSPALGGRRSGSFSIGGRAQMGYRSSSLSSIPGMSSAIPINSRARNGSLARTGSAVGMFSAHGTPPPDLFDYSLLDEAGVSSWVNPSSWRGGTFGSRKEDLDFDSDDLESPPGSPKKSPAQSGDFPPPAPRSGGSNGQNKSRSKQDKSGKSGKDKEANGTSSATSAPIVIPKPKQGDKGSASRTATASSAKKSNGGAAKEEKAPAAPPTTMTAEERAASRRAQGVPMIGAYSPESRRLRVERFVAKRDRRVWKKKVKYDVRKNFADSRLRVKGRFVKKEDEEMLRDLMTMV